REKETHRRKRSKSPCHLFTPESPLTVTLCLTKRSVKVFCDRGTEHTDGICFCLRRPDFGIGYVVSGFSPRSPPWNRTRALKPATTCPTRDESISQTFLTPAFAFFDCKQFLHYRSCHTTERQLTLHSKVR